MASAHDAFKALGPINWDSIDRSQLKTLMVETFTDAHCLIDSIPVSLTGKGGQHGGGRPRSSTDPSSPQLPERARKTSERSQELRKEWKDCHVNPRENPLGVDVYKLASKDRKGAWFARRSVHQGLTFERWKVGMEREFAETLKIQGPPGAGKIRGIGADKRVESIVVEGCGKLEVFQLSAQFPAVAAREFITLLLSSDSAIEPPMEEGHGTDRYFMVVSKPCVHPQCSQRQGYVRGQYESVELIREIRVDRRLRRVRSSIALSNEDGVAARMEAAEQLGRKGSHRSTQRPKRAALSSDREKGSGVKTTAYSGDGGARHGDAGSETMIEWLMVTRSDPGGSVPRFMVEKGTPAGIAGDAKKFLDWITSKGLEDVDGHGADEATPEKDTEDAEMHQRKRKEGMTEPTRNIITNPGERPRHRSLSAGSIPRRESRVIEARKPDVGPEAQQESLQPSGFYGMIAGALNAAAEAATSRLPNPFGTGKEDDGDTDSPSQLSPDDNSSTCSFHSVEADQDEAQSIKTNPEEPVPAMTANGDALSLESSDSAVAKSPAPSYHEKELRKLEERRRKMAEKLQRAQHRALSRKDQDSQRDETAVAKMREKHEREIAKQAEKYRRDLRRLEDKRARDERRAEERRRKMAVREEKSTLALELDKVRAERDVALKQIELLKETIGDLQEQNTKLVAKFGAQITPDLSDIVKDLKRSHTGSNKELAKKIVPGLAGA